MGWCGPDEHEGWVQMRLQGAKYASGTSTGAGVYAEGYGYIAGEIDPAFLRPWSDVTGWRMACECGWRGRVTYPVPDDGRKYPDPTEDEEETLLLPSWQAHVAPFRAVEKLADLADEARSLDDRLTAAVRLARSAGASWSTIGHELGMTKQGAQQRYGD
jgi:hypothetical protein